MEYHFKEIDQNTICDFENSFRSTHNRADKNNVLIHHLFFGIKKST